jgi:hypothetical protein
VARDFRTGLFSQSERSSRGGPVCAPAALARLESCIAAVGPALRPKGRHRDERRQGGAYGRHRRRAKPREAGASEASDRRSSAAEAESFALGGWPARHCTLDLASFARSDVKGPKARGSFFPSVCDLRGASDAALGQGAAAAQHPVRRQHPKPSGR